MVKKVIGCLLSLVISANAAAVNIEKPAFYNKKNQKPNIIKNDNLPTQLIINQQEKMQFQQQYNLLIESIIKKPSYSIDQLKQNRIKLN